MLLLVHKGVFIIPHADVTLTKAVHTLREQHAGRDNPPTLQ